MIQMAYPWVLVALIVPWLLRLLLPRANTPMQAALKIPFFKGLQQQFIKRAFLAKQTFYSWRSFCLLLIWILVVLSGTGLQLEGAPLQLPRDGRDILLAIDLSGSMQTPDMTLHGKAQSRLAIVKQVAQQFVAKRVGDRIGLVLFGTHAYLQTPLTFDRKTVEYMLNDATIGLAGIQTAIGDAIGLSIKRLLPFPTDSRALILMTDGGNDAGTIDPIEAAKVAAKAGIKIYTIGLGAKRMVVNGAFGPQVINPSSDLDVHLLQQIATLTGGEFFRANEGDTLEKVYQEINQLEPIKGDKVTLRPKRPLYPYPLTLALVLSIGLILSYLWRRREREQIHG